MMDENTEEISEGSCCPHWYIYSRKASFLIPFFFLILEN